MRWYATIQIVARHSLGRIFYSGTKRDSKRFKKSIFNGLVLTWNSDGTGKDESRRSSVYSQGSGAEPEPPVTATMPTMSTAEMMVSIPQPIDTPLFPPVSASPMPEPTSDPRYKPVQSRTPKTPSTFGTFLRPSSKWVSVWSGKKSSAFGLETFSLLLYAVFVFFYCVIEQ